MKLSWKEGGARVLPEGESARAAAAAAVAPVQEEEEAVETSILLPTI